MLNNMHPIKENQVKKIDTDYLQVLPYMYIDHFTMMQKHFTQLNLISMKV